MRVHRLDHLVLTVRDVETSCLFYQRVLGMEVVSFGHGRKALRFGDQKINLHQAGREIEPMAATPTPGSADICLLTTTPVTQAAHEIRTHGIEVIEGPVERAGTRGPLRSIYLRDPDGNLIEVANERGPDGSWPA